MCGQAAGQYEQAVPVVAQLQCQHELLGAGTNEAAAQQAGDVWLAQAAQRLRALQGSKDELLHALREGSSSVSKHLGRAEAAMKLEGELQRKIKGAQLWLQVEALALAELQHSAAVHDSMPRTLD